MTTSLTIPPGFGIKNIKREAWPAGLPKEELFDIMQVFELPQKGRRYVLAADISDGIGQDRSVADVFAVGDLTHPDEQVAQFITNQLDPVTFAGIIDAMANFYIDDEGEGALVAIENNNHGLACQTHLQHHWGYNNLFIWQAYDRRNPRAALSNSYGWVTNSRTRPMILTYLVRALQTKDPITGTRDVIVHSDHTISEMLDFEAPDGGQLWQAAAIQGAHDDCIMTAAIALWVCQTLHFDENEPMAEARRRKAEEENLKLELNKGELPGPHNTDWTAEEIQLGAQADWNDESMGGKDWF